MEHPNSKPSIPIREIHVDHVADLIVNALHRCERNATTLSHLLQMVDLGLMTASEFYKGLLYARHYDLVAVGWLEEAEARNSYTFQHENEIITCNFVMLNTSTTIDRIARSLGVFPAIRRK